ncbi:secreted trypsin-like serine protease [Saccharothrix tamanrassetensis]|uniref:Secreted trypsin-like serine protease n=1 Tax=Saccharothrix tamanrassetensis TaxID=1051531 RepID=A0A841C9H5_9PSEU|nr:serine protease [Saccharothrix tamanrassetensis]MBB5953610.1 secreted trypsin-like serine protease [Saccharothrix tamanrassetensis]
MGKVRRSVAVLASIIAISSSTVVGSGAAQPGVTGGARRIANGSPSARLYSFMGSLQYSADGSHSCGASLISPHWMVTAAHCVEVDQPAQLQVRVGSQDRTIGGSVVDVGQIVVHPGYHDVSEGHDIALLQLVGSAPQQPIRIATDEEAAESRKLTRILGWGSTCPDRGELATCGFPVTLQWLNTSVLDAEDCGGRQRAGELCTNSPNRNSGNCRGDSGGPQIARLSETLVGLSSRNTTDRCGAGPSIFTDVTHYRDWIDEVTGSSA